MKALFLTLFLIFVSCYGQRSFSPGNKVPGWRGITPAGQKAIKDSIKQAVSDSIRQANYITWGYLTSDLQARIEAGNLYDYQDATINSELQMYVRDAHYLHEKYYVEDDSWYLFSYDLTSSLFLKDRRALVRYLWLLKVLHETTGDSRYWNPMLSIYEDIRDSTATITYSGGTLTCKTVVINPDNSSEDGWPYSDTLYHLVGRYIYEQDNSYTTYNDEFKDFASCYHSYISKTVFSEGWAHGYSWDATAASNLRINTNAPALRFWAYLDKKGITTDSLTAATIDTTIDSIYAVVDNAWVADSTSGGGSYELRIGDGTPSYLYTHVWLFAWPWIVTLYADTSWRADNSVRIRDMVKYRIHDGADNIILAHNGEFNYWNYLGKKFCDVWGLDYNKPKMGASSGAIVRWGSHFDGINFPMKKTAMDQRNTIASGYSVLAEMIGIINDENINETYTSFVRDTWTDGKSNYSYYDGTQSTERNYIGLRAANANYNVGYQTLDSSPGTDTLNWTISNGILTYSTTTVSTQNFDITKSMGTPYKLVVPQTNADSVFIDVQIPGSADGDSVYIFYYNSLGVLDTLKNTTLSIGDSILFQPDKGIFANIVRADSPSSGGHGAGFIANPTTSYLRLHSEYSTYRRYILTTTLADSAIVYTVYHEQDNGFLNTPSDWQYTLDWVSDILNHAQQIWENGLTYEGILEDKTQ